MGMETLGGSMRAGRPVVLASGNTTQVFAIDAQGVMNRWTSLGAAWAGPHLLAGPTLPDSFACGVALPNGSVQIFAIGAGSQLTRWRSTDGWRASGPPQSIPAAGNGPAAVLTPDGQIHVFAIARAPVDAILHYSFAAGADVMPAGQPLPGSNGLHPSVLAAVSAGGRIDVFAAGTSLAGVSDGTPLHWHFAGNWSKRFLPGPVLHVGPGGGNGFAAIAPAVDRVELFAISSDQLITQWSLGAQSTSATPPPIVLSSFTQRQLPHGGFGAVPDGVPAVAVTQTGDLEVFAIGAGGAFNGGRLLHWRADAGVWRGAVAHDASLAPGGVGAVGGAVFAYGTDNTLRHWPAGIGGGTQQPWQNWAANQRTAVLGHCYPTCVEEVVAIIKTAAQKGRHVRAVGSSWSLSDVAMTPDYVVETSGFSQTIMTVVPAALVATITSAMPAGGVVKPKNLIHIEAGIQLEALMRILDNSQQAPFTMGGASGQTVAGLISTSVHGSDFGLPPFPDAVRAIHLVAPDGRQHWIEPNTARVTDAIQLAGVLGPEVTLHYDDDWFDSVLVSVGSLGIIYSVILEVTDQYQLEERCEKLAWSDVAGVRGLRSQLADGSVFSALIRTRLTDGSNFVASRRCVQVAIDTTFSGSDPVGFMTSRVVQTTAQAQASIGGTPFSLGGDGVDVLGAFCESDLIDVLFVVGFPLGATFVAAVTGALSILGLAPLIPVVMPLAAVAGPALIAGLKAGPPGTLGDFVSEVVNAMPTIAPAVVAFFTNQALKVGTQDGSPGGTPTRRNIAHQVMAPWNNGECFARAHALEMAFDATDGSHLRFLDAAFVALKAEAIKGNILGGWFAIRFVGRSRAILSPQQSAMTCMVETVGLRALNSTAPLLAMLETLGRSLGGIQHWGMFKDLRAADVDVAYPRLDTWLQVRHELTNGGKLDTFDNVFSIRAGLTVAPNPPRVTLPNGTALADPYSFDTVELHQQKAVTFHFKNAGGRTLRVLGLSADGDFRDHDVAFGAKRNLILETLTASARNGFEIEVKATFLGAAAGAHAGTLTIRTNAREPAGGAIRIPLTARVAVLDVRAVQPMPGTVLNLGSIDVGASSVAAISVRNAGTMTAALIAYTFSSAEAATQIDIQIGAIAAGQTHAYTVTYSPIATGLLTTDVSLHFTDGLTPPQHEQVVSFTLIATGVGARAELTPATLEFGTVIAGAESAAKPVLLRNVGQKSLTITGWPQFAQFRLIGTPPTTVAPGQDVQLSVAFRPGLNGDVSNELTLLSSNSTPPPSPVSMHGVGVVQSLLSAKPAGLVFGAVPVPVGSRSETQVVAVQNVGHTIVQLGVTGIVGAGSANFRVLATTAGVVLQREATFEVRIVFVPTSARTLEATLEVAHDGPSSPLRIALSGQAIRPRGLVPNVIDVDFGRVAVGLSGSHKIAWVNAEPTDANIASVVISGAAAADFKIDSDECSGSVLAPGANCVIVLSARPSAAGLRAASLQVNADVQANPVSLHVEGVAASTTWIPALIDFGPIAINATSDLRAVDLHNAGNATLTVSHIDLTGDFTFAQLVPNWMTIAPNGEMSFRVRFKPTTAGQHQSWLRVHSDAPGSPHLLELTGVTPVRPPPRPPRPIPLPIPP